MIVCLCELGFLVCALFLVWCVLLLFRVLVYPFLVITSPLVLFVVFHIVVLLLFSSCFSPRHCFFARACGSFVHDFLCSYIFVLSLVSCFFVCVVFLFVVS